MWGQTCNYNEKENSFLIMMLPMYDLPLSWWQSKHPFKGTITEPILTSIFFSLSYMNNVDLYHGYGYGFCVECHFQQYFSYISWRSVLLVEQTGVPLENH